MEMNKARNLIEHEEEIFSRPPRVWFQNKADLKRKSGNYIKFELFYVGFDSEVKFDFFRLLVLQLMYCCYCYCCCCCCCCC